MDGRNKYEGFTLIEILVVVGLIAILAAITIVAINPARNFESTRNTQRSSDISSILNAITQYTSEEGNSLQTLEDGLAVFTGTIETCTSTTPSTALSPIGKDVVASGTSNNEATYVDLESVLVDTYVVEIPEDPNGSWSIDGGGTATGYSMCQTGGGRVQVVATATEGGGTDLYVTR